MIYQSHMEKSDWSEFTTMVQVKLMDLQLTNQIGTSEINGPPTDQSDCCICYNYILNHVEISLESRSIIGLPRAKKKKKKRCTVQQ